MNYSFLDYNKPLPDYYKPMGFALVFICFAAGFYLKISSSETIFDFTTSTIRIIYFLSLGMILLSKSKIEDERSQELKLQIIKFGYGMLMFLFFITELGAVNDRSVLRNNNLFFFFTSILGLQIVLFSTLNYTKVIDYIEKNKLKYRFAVASVLMTLFYLNKRLWTI